MLFSVLAVSATTAAADEGQQQQPAQPNATQTQTSTTTTTAAPTTSAAIDSPLAPQPAIEPEQRDTVTLYQRYRPNRAYLYTGGAMFIGSYATTAAVNATENVDRTLFIPIVGPWLHLADRPDDASTTGTVLIVGSGVVQGVGALLTAASFFIPERVPAATIQAGNVKMNLTPAAYGRGTAGLAAVGTF
jgi:hypothetical protein